MPELPEMQALAERLEPSSRGAVLERRRPLGFSALKTVCPGPRRSSARHLLGGGPARQVPRASRLTATSAVAAPPLPGRAPRHSRRRRSARSRRARRCASASTTTARCSCASTATSARRRGGCSRRATTARLERLGPEPDSDEFETLRCSHGADKRRIHTMLRDQRTVAGIGRGYADDALHRAKLSPYATLAEARRRGTRVGSSTRCAPRSPTRSKPSARARVASRPRSSATGSASTTAPARRARSAATPMRRVSFESHEITYCPACQTNGKVLADRRMSRLVK